MKSWLKYTLRTAAILLSATLLTTSCLQSDFDEPLLAGDTVKVSFNPTLDNNETTRVGEGKSVNILYAELYLDKNLIGERHEYNVSEGNISGFSMELLKNQTYTIVFWAQNKNCGAYDTSDLSKIQINYPENIDFSDIENSDIEKYDAFYAKCDVTVNAETIAKGVDIKLTRPFALVVAGTNEQVETNTTSSLTFSSIATQFDAFTGKASEGAEKTISFEPNNSTKVPGKEQVVMLGIAYVLPMPNLENTTVTVTTTLDGQSKDTGINIPNLTANKRYNLLGSDLVVDAGWGGNYSLLPAAAGDGWIHITEAEQLATLLRDGYDNSENEINGIHLCASFNMGGKEITPTETATFKNVIIDGAAYSVNPTYNLDTPIDENRITEGGGIYELKGLNISGKGVFNSTDTFTARYIKFTNVTVNSAAEAGGVVGTATGSLTLTNITVSDGTVTGANKVGGLVGYIDSATGTTATLTDCSSSATVNATAKAGALVGWFNGYDESETLNFIDCSTTSESTFTTPFCGDEQACFNTNDLALSTYEQHLLGGEEYCRGTINYGYVDGDGNLTSERFFYRWDGVRKVTPLTENSSTSIYSPYDLADCQGKSITSMTFYNDVDMGGQGIDGKFYIPTEFTQSAQDSDDDRPFSPISTVKTLNGAKSSTDNYTIYNLYIKRLNSGTSNAFIQTANGTTTHKNLNFNNCCTVATHKEVTTDAKAYGAIVCCNIDATYTMENVHATECKVFALQKVGTLAARVAGTSTLQNCTVNNCYVENYKCMIPELFESGPKEMAGFKVDNVTANFFPYGEIGGMFGFIQGSSTLKSCKVRGTTIFAYGQNDTKADVKTSGWQGMIVQIGISALGLYYVPGRHVGTLIGDIRATGTITLTDCDADSESKCTNRWDKHCWKSGSTHKTYDYIGQCYIVKFLDSEGSVTVDSTSLTINKCSTKDGICYDHNVAGN